MQHQRKRTNKKKLGRSNAAYRAVRRDGVQNLILYEKIVTTPAKAHVIRPVVERLIQTAKRQTLASRRVAIRFLTSDVAVQKLIEKVAPKYNDRQGGYVRMIKLSPRKGDNAPQVKLELV